MNKFMKLIAENTPAEPGEVIEMDVARAVSRAVKEANIDGLELLMNDERGSDLLYVNYFGQMAQLNVTFMAVMTDADRAEEEEDTDQTIKTISAIASIPDPKGGVFKSKTQRDLGAAKKKMAGAAIKVADNFANSV